MDFEEKSEEISINQIKLKIKEFVKVITENYKIILLIGIISSSISIFYAARQKTQYTATLTFALEEDKAGGGVGAIGGIASQFGIDLGSSGGGAFSSSNLNELMKSRLLIERTLLKPVIINNKVSCLVEYYLNKKNQTTTRLHFSPFDDRNTFTIEKDSILKDVYYELTDSKVFNISQKDKKISITSVEIKNDDEFFTKTFCETLVKETSDYYIELKIKKAKNNVDILKREVDSIKSELYNSISNVGLSSDAVYNLNPAYLEKRSSTSKNQINVQYKTALLTQLYANLEIATITLRKETPLIQVIDKPILPLEKKLLTKRKASIIGFLLGIFVASLYYCFKKLNY